MTRDEVLIELARVLPDYTGDLPCAADKLYARLFGEADAAEEHAPINWNLPIEAVHEDGRVMANEVHYGPDDYGDYQMLSYVPDENGAEYFMANGQPRSPWLIPGWRIRNVGSK